MTNNEIKASILYYSNDLKSAAKARDYDEMRFLIDRIRDLMYDLTQKNIKHPAYKAKHATIEKWCDEVQKQVA